MSTTFNKFLKSKLALILAFATVTFAVTTAALPAQAQRSYSDWGCYLNNQENQLVDNVRIWWGHTPGDAAWACNSWISDCGNQGGCFAKER